MGDFKTQYNEKKEKKSQVVKSLPYNQLNLQIKDFIHSFDKYSLKPSMFQVLF